ncbi:hypothetical protein [Pseudomonas hunanensis]
MARSTKMMIPGIPFCLAALAADGLALYASAAIGLICIGTGCVFWMIDGE